MCSAGAQVANDHHIHQVATAQKAAPEKSSHILHQHTEDVLRGHSRSVAEEPPGPALGAEDGTTPNVAHKG